MNRRAYREAHGLCLEILKSEPDFADAYFLLGMIAFAHRQIAKALELIDRALSNAPDNAEYLAHRAQCLTLLKRDAEALEVAERALALEPRQALTLDTIGVVLSKVGAHEKAKESLRRAIALKPNEPQFHFNLASSLQFLGEFEKAAESYEKAVALKPDFYRAHWALAELRKATPEINDAERLKALLPGASKDADAMLYLCHGLAKIHEDLGEWAAAFDYLQQGKRLKAKQVDYRFSSEAELFGVVKSLCNEEFLAGGSPGFDSDEPIFVVGMPRTGTTLVERILSSHDDVFSAGELNDFGLTLKRMTGTPSRRVLDTETVRAAQRIDFSKVGEDYIQATRPRTGNTPYFIDKMPLNYLYAGFIRKALPRAKIVCLRRDPLDTCWANFKQLFATEFSYYNYAYDLRTTGEYYLLFDDLARHWRSTLGDAYLEIRYEDVVADLEGEARRLLSFCGLGWDDRVLSFHENTSPVATASAVQVRSPIYSSSVGRWKRYGEQLEPLVDLFASRGIVVQ